MAEPGRPPVLDQQKKHDICTVLAVGCSRRTAAEFVGCSPATIRRTARRDPQFAAALVKAESRSEVACLQDIRAAAKKAQYWRAAAWVLERRRPAEYAARTPGAVTADQMQDLLRDLAEILFEETLDPKARQRIRRRVGAMARSLGVVAGAERCDEQG